MANPILDALLDIAGAAVSLPFEAADSIFDPEPDGDTKLSDLTVDELKRLQK